MWINERTGKGWTDEEEQAFAELMATGLSRIAAIQMWKRFKKDLPKALKYARGGVEAKAGYRNGAAKRATRAVNFAESGAGERSRVLKGGSA